MCHESWTQAGSCNLSWNQTNKGSGLSQRCLFRLGPQGPNLRVVWRSNWFHVKYRNHRLTWLSIRRCTSTKQVSTLLLTTKSHHENNVHRDHGQSRKVCHRSLAPLQQEVICLREIKTEVIPYLVKYISWDFPTWVGNSVLRANPGLSDVRSGGRDLLIRATSTSSLAEASSWFMWKYTCQPLEVEFRYTDAKIPGFAYFQFDVASKFHAHRTLLDTSLEDLARATVFGIRVWQILDNTAVTSYTHTLYDASLAPHLNIEPDSAAQHPVKARILDCMWVRWFSDNRIGAYAPARCTQLRSGRISTDVHRNPDITIMITCGHYCCHLRDWFRVMATDDAC